MTLKGSVKFIFETKSVGNIVPNNIYPDMIDDQTITMEVPYIDMNIHQYFNLFNSFVRSLGFDEILIMKGACGLAFNDMRDQEDMKKIAEEFELKLAEDYSKEFRKMQDEIYDLKSKLSRLEQPENPQYIDEEMNSMEYQEWKGLVPGSKSARMMGCKCPIMDNEEMSDDRKWVNGDCPLHGKVK